MNEDDQATNIAALDNEIYPPEEEQEVASQEEEQDTQNEPEPETQVEDEDTSPSETERPKLLVPPVGPLPDLFDAQQVEGIADALGMTTQQVTLLTQLIGVAAGRTQQEAALANQHVFAAQQEQPQWFAHYGANVQYHLANMQANFQRQGKPMPLTREAVVAAQMATIQQEVYQTGDLAETLRRHADLLSGNAPAPRPQQQQRQQAREATMPRTQVAPSGTGLGSRPQVTQSDRVQFLQKLQEYAGLDETEALTVMGDPMLSRGRR